MRLLKTMLLCTGPRGEGAGHCLLLPPQTEVPPPLPALRQREELRVSGRRSQVALAFVLGFETQMSPLYPTCYKVEQRRFLSAPFVQHFLNYKKILREFQSF